MTSDTPGVSDKLAAFVAEAPVARGPHLDFLRSAADSLAPGSKVLDVGAGEAPYRELFAAHEYLTCDWEGSIYEPESPPDIVASAEAIPLEDGVIDAIVCTQVLEHVPEPSDVLSEFHRLVRPGGHVFVTTPLTWYLHETPHDYYRFTSYGLSHLLTKAGFVDVHVVAMNDSLATIAELLRQLPHITGPNDDEHDIVRLLRSDTLARFAPVVEALGEIDSKWLLPISFAARAKRPLPPPF